MQKEIWKSAVGFEGLYEVSNLGNVRSIDRYTVYSNGHSRITPGREMRLQENHNGYLVVGLSRGAKKMKVMRVHRLVAEAFIENKDGKKYVNHIDLNKKNNSAGNLEWVTITENAKHAKESGAIRRGEEHFGSKTTEQQARKVIEMLEGDHSYAEIKKETGVGIGIIAGINTKGAWTHLEYNKSKRSAYRGKIPIESIKMIQEMHKYSEENKIGHRTRPFSFVWLSRCFKISSSQVENLVHGRCWKKETGI